MNRKTLATLILIASAGAVIVGAEQAKSQAKAKPVPKTPTMISGEIVAVDAATHTFTLRTSEIPARELKFRAQAGSKVLVNGQSKAVTDLTRGERVKVSYTGSGAVLDATAVTLEQPRKKG
jgi:hypothetical protein